LRGADGTHSDASLSVAQLIRKMLAVELDGDRTDSVRRAL